jgi:hypothetical protein
MKKVVLSFLLTVLMSGFCFAQEQIDVKSIVISHRFETKFNMVAANSAGQDVTYLSTNSNAMTLGTMGTCCRLPAVQTSDLFAYSPNKEFIRVQMSIANNNAIKLYLSSPTITDDIVLRPKIRKRQTIEVKGQTKLFISKIEVLDNNGNVVAVDNDVTLDGSYLAIFNKDAAWNLYLYNKITYTFDEPRN